MFLRITDGRGPIMFGSRESPDVTLHPKLELIGKAGALSFDAVADSYLPKSTYRSQGQNKELRVSAAPDHLLIRFDLKQAAKLGSISKGTLVLQTTKQFGSAGIGVFRCRQGHDEPTSLPVLGIAARHENDRGIAEDPEEINFWYYLRLANDWNQTVQGGKLPRISGTYGRAGWGERKSNGANGWSARGLFRMTVPAGSPLEGRPPIGFYCYHADMKGVYGTNWVWSKDYRGYLETNRWYAIEQYCRLNTSVEKNGVLRAWGDGHLTFEKTDVRFRLTDELRIEPVWMNVLPRGQSHPSMTSTYSSTTW